MNHELLQTPIRVPKNPFWDVFTRFGRDEMIAMVANILGTAGVDYALGGAALSPKMRAVILSVAGPVIEKVGFFPAHFKDAFEVYRTTSPAERLRLSKYFKDAMKGGSVSLAEDVLVHDPLYIACMYAGMQFYPGTPPWILATVSFILALFAVAAGEVGVNEARYLLKKMEMRRVGFDVEKYYESRFFISSLNSSVRPNDLLDVMTERFDLSVRTTGEYHDRYFDCSLPGYSGRNVKLRLRQRILEDEGRVAQTAQVIYRRVSEVSKSELSQYRYFPQLKEKFYYMLRDTNMPGDPSEVEDGKLRSWLAGIRKNPWAAKNVRFKRSIARRTPDGLFVSVDGVEDERPFYLVELKVYKDLKLLKEAMRFVMREFPVTQITHSKEEVL